MTCKLTSISHSEKKIRVKPKYDCFRLFQFDFIDLDPQETYTYHFFYNDKNGNLKELNLGNGLTYKDCKFKVLGNGKESSFILLSCNNPFQTEKGSADDGWTMWEKLGSHLKDDNSVRFIVLGGDQVYNDDIEKKFIKKNLSKDELKTEFITQYEKYWGHTSYRKIFASVPSVAMWDDHDITDGWGSRPESFPKNPMKQIKNHIYKKPHYFKDNWWQYFKVAREAFTAYQDSRNSNKIDNTPEKVFSSYLDWEENRLILCDFRSERNSKKKMLWSHEHKEAVLNFIKSSPEQIKRIFFLTPVVALRTNFLGDKRLNQFSRLLFYIKKKYKELPVFYKFAVILISLFILFGVPYLCLPLKGFFPKVFYYACHTAAILIFAFLGISHIPEFPNLSDDITDGLSSEVNRKHLKEILDELTKFTEKKEVFILSGDIHLGGLTEIIDTRDNKRKSILQIVSSPIAYKPMPKVIEGLTTTTSEMVLRECSDNNRLFARNIFYISKRNFVQITPSKMNEGQGIKFFLEGHQLPMVFPKKFLEN